MQLKFEQQLASLVSEHSQKKWLIAVSGGLDSMVLLHLMLELKLNIAVAHCNFGLRAEASDADASLVSTFCHKHQIPFHLKVFETEKFAQDNRLSTQMAARELRYSWFENLRQTEGFDFVCTAHHLDDQLETFIINLSRGTGLNGLTGIPALQKNICRPLLHFSRLEIESFAEKHQILWREDASNQSDYYLRNQIRHHVTPALKNISHDFLSSFEKTLSHLQDSQSLIRDAMQNFQETCVIFDEHQVLIDLNSLKQFQNPNAYLYSFLNPFGFTAWQDVFQLIHSQTGKMVVSPSHHLLKNRETLVLTLNKKEKKHSYIINQKQEELNFPIKLRFSEVSALGESNANTIFVDSELLEFPLTIRKWESGDMFFPFGMSGSKKVSKYFKDEKMSLHEKNQIWLLCSKNQIVWIIGKRFDRRFQINNLTKTILQITLHS
jgi:tRNA(Ile)-lysidine synthase